MIATCRHCSKSKVNRPRGLCWSCYYTPGVKELYPSTSKYARRGVGNFTGNGGIEAFRVKPAGAGFEIDDYHDFLKPFYPTDVQVGYDGKVYVSKA